MFHTTYDGTGQRVKKVAGAVTTIFVYNAAGQMIAEYDNSNLPAASPGTTYITADTLGSPRLLTTGQATVKARHDYAPFGEELTPQLGGRSSQQQYVIDDLRQKFTGQERDSETGLDYFHARYYASNQGRFTSADPLLASGETGNPQTWNRYAYVMNNPVNSTDPSGLVSLTGGGKGMGNTEGVWYQSYSNGPKVSYLPLGDPTMPATIPGPDSEPEPSDSPDTSQSPQQSPVVPCPCQNFSFPGATGNYTAEELGELMQMGVGEAGNVFTPGEIEAIMAGAVNRQNINISVYPEKGPYAGGSNTLIPYQNGSKGILSEYVAYQSRDGETKLQQVKDQNNGVLPQQSYVCQQMLTAQAFALVFAEKSATDVAKSYPYTSNKGQNKSGGYDIPAGSVNIKAFGKTRVSIDKIAVKYFKDKGVKLGR